MTIDKKQPENFLQLWTCREGRTLRTGMGGQREPDCPGADAEHRRSFAVLNRQRQIIAVNDALLGSLGSPYRKSPWDQAGRGIRLSVCQGDGGRMRNLPLLCHLRSSGGDRQLSRRNRPVEQKCALQTGQTGICAISVSGSGESARHRVGAGHPAFFAGYYRAGTVGRPGADVFQ